MRCECCNKVLSDKEATARYAPNEGERGIRYVGMCTECQGFLPASVKILTRHDLVDASFDEFPTQAEYDRYVDDFFMRDIEEE